MGWSYTHTINGKTYTTGTQFTLNGTVNCYASCDKTNPLYVKNSNTAWYYGRYDASYSKHPYCISTTRPGLPDLFVDATAFPPAMYSITYNLNGGSGNFPTHYKTHGGSAILHAHVPTKTGYTFAGWGTSPSSEQPAYQAGQAVGGNSNMVLYAIWRGKECILTFDARGGTANAPEVVYCYGQTIKQLPTPTKAGHCFIGWRVNSEDGEPLTLHYIMRGSIIAVAIWEAIEQQVIVNPMGGAWDGDTDTKTHTVLFGTNLRIPSPTLEGYLFTGWTCSNGDYITASQDGLCAVMIRENLVLTANWEEVIPDVYLVTFDAHTNRGTGSFTITVPRGWTLDAMFSDETGEPGASKPCCTFLGWYDNPAGIGNPIVIGFTVVNSPLTLYACFKKEHSVSIVTEGAYNPAITAVCREGKYRQQAQVWTYKKGEWVRALVYEQEE